MWWLSVGCHDGRVRDFLTHIVSSGSLPFYPEPAFNICADWRISWPVPGPGSGPVWTRSLPPHPEEGGEDGKGEEKYEAGMELIKNRWLYTCDSAFQNWAETELSACGAPWFQPFSHPLTFFHRKINSPPKGGNKCTYLWLKPLLLPINSCRFTTPGEIQIRRTLMLTHLEIPKPLPPWDHAFPSSRVIGGDVSESRH